MRNEEVEQVNERIQYVRPLDGDAQQSGSKVGMRVKSSMLFPFLSLYSLFSTKTSSRRCKRTWT